MKTIITMCLSIICFWVKAQEPTNTGVEMGQLMPGKNAVYGIVPSVEGRSSFNSYKGMVKQFDVYKDENGRGNFKKINTLTFPNSFDDFTKRAGNVIADAVKNALEVTDGSAAYKQLQSGNIKSLAMFLISKEFLRGMGMIWEDENIKNTNPTTAYRVVKVNSDGKEQILFTQKISEVKRVPFGAYRLKDLVNADSVIQLTWAAKLTNAPAVFGKIYRLKNGEKSYQLVNPPSLFYSVNDTSKTFYAEEVKPGQLYRYYVVPEDFVGNQGLPSDTAYAVSKSFSQIKGITNLSIKDSLKGAWLSWKALPNEGIYTGVQILKSRKSTDGFIEVATLSATDSSYFDKAILPNVTYHYQVRPLTIQIKGYTLLPAATANIAVKSQHDIPMAPQGLKVWQDSTAQVKLFWDVNPEIDQFAYYVLRGTSKDDMRIVSGALRTNTYTDSLQNLNGKSTYFYGIQLMNISQKMSEVSLPVMFKPLKVEFVPYPSGLGVRYADEAVKLFWENMIEKNDGIVGYRVFRKLKTEKEFKSLNEAPLRTTVFDDTTVAPGYDYEYAVSAIDASANQSILSPVSSITIPLTTILAAPADLYLIDKPEGIYVSWPAHNNLKLTNSIYRKSNLEKEFKLIASVETNDFYIDASAQKGALYSYRIVAKTKLGISEPGIEKSIRRN